MPYRLVQFPDGYRVMTEETGAFHSTDALPLARAKRQMTALNLALAREKGYDVPPPPQAKGGAKTYRQKFLDRYELPDRSYSLEEVSKITSVPMDILQEVYNRGIGAYKTNPQSVRLKGSFVKNVAAPLSKKLSKEQWAMARVMSFVMGNPKHDNDLRANAKGGLLSTPLPALPPPKGDAYLTTARKKARDAGIEGRITYAPKPHKLQIEAPDGRVVRFGRQGYGDHLLWSKAEADGKVPKGTADTKRRQYRARATKIKGDWKSDKYSPNNLAINVLW